MRMFRWLELILPGKIIQVSATISSLLLFVFPVQAQDSTAIIPFKESAKFTLSQLWLEDNPLPFQEFNNEIPERKSPSRAFFSSLLLPGTGEAYVGEYTQSKIFIGIEHRCLRGTIVGYYPLMQTRR